MFGKPTLTVDAAARFIRARGCEVEVLPPPTRNDIGRLACVDRGVPFWITLSGRGGVIDNITFFTAVPKFVSLELINSFNGKFRFSKAYAEGDSTCVTMNLISPTGKFPEDYLGNAFALWELGLPDFGEMVIDAS